MVDSQIAQPRNIQERSFEFAVRIVRLVDRLPHTTAGIQIGRQLMASGTSIGANAQEADAAETKADFIHKIGVALKEAQETQYWLRLVEATVLPNDAEVKPLLRESLEIARVLGAIKRNARLPKSPRRD
ncbi:MAG: four helix bundle protein [Chloroflexi bacterium]|nr:four helix bundle protein [Chloroflexota bacterium]